MTGKGVDIGDPLRFSCCRCGAAYAGSDGYPDTGRLALKRPQHQLVAHQAIETGPVEFRYILPDQRGDIGHIGDRIRLAVD